MCRWKCPELVSILRTRTGFVSRTLIAAATIAVLWHGHLKAQANILPPDAAARAFSQGRDALRKGNADAAIRFFEQALATGHDRPAARLGTNRYFVDHYDPYYLLGVAYQQKGEKERARAAFQRSLSFGLVQQWPEGADLARRLQELTPRPEITQTVVTPTPQPRETPTPVEVRITLPQPPPPVIPTPTPSVPEPRISVVPATRTPAQQEWTPEFRSEVSAVLEAAQKANWPVARTRVRALKSRHPELPQPALLEAVVLGSQFLLEGSRDERLRRSARESLAEFRRLGGTPKQESVWLSPSLGAALAY